MTSLDYILGMFIVTYITFGIMLYGLMKDVNLLRDKVKELDKRNKGG